MAVNALPRAALPMSVVCQVSKLHSFENPVMSPKVSARYGPVTAAKLHPTVPGQSVRELLLVLRRKYLSEEDHEFTTKISVRMPHKNET